MWKTFTTGVAWLSAATLVAPAITIAGTSSPFPSCANDVTEIEEVSRDRNQVVRLAGRNPGLVSFCGGSVEIEGADVLSLRIDRSPGTGTFDAQLWRPAGLPGVFVCYQPYDSEPRDCVHVALPPECLGDCDGDGYVSISELMVGVRIATQELPLATCNAFAMAAVPELVRAVRAALFGCAVIALPDLIPQNLWAVSPQEYVSVCVQNLGAAASGGFDVRLDTLFEDAQVLPFDSLEPGARRCMHPPFAFQTHAVVDPGNEVAESIEANNDHPVRLIVE